MIHAEDLAEGWHDYEWDEKNVQELIEKVQRDALQAAKQIVRDAQSMPLFAHPKDMAAHMLAGGVVREIEELMPKKHKIGSRGAPSTYQPPHL